MCFNVLCQHACAHRRALSNLFWKCKLCDAWAAYADPTVAQLVLTPQNVPHNMSEKEFWTRYTRHVFAKEVGKGRGGGRVSAGEGERGKVSMGQWEKVEKVEKVGGVE